MREHLMAPLQEGGHGFSDASYSVAWTDSDEFHEYDHNSGTWFSEALLHTHDDEQTDMDLVTDHPFQPMIGFPDVCGRMVGRLDIPGDDWPCGYSEAEHA